MSSSVHQLRYCKPRGRAAQPMMWRFTLGVIVTLTMLLLTAIFIAGIIDKATKRPNDSIDLNAVRQSQIDFSANVFAAVASAGFVILFGLLTIRWYFADLERNENRIAAKEAGVTEVIEDFEPHRGRAQAARHRE